VGSTYGVDDVLACAAEVTTSDQDGETMCRESPHIQAQLRTRFDADGAPCRDVLFSKQCTTTFTVRPSLGSSLFVCILREDTHLPSPARVRDARTTHGASRAPPQLWSRGTSRAARRRARRPPRRPRRCPATLVACTGRSKNHFGTTCTLHVRAL